MSRFGLGFVGGAPTPAVLTYAGLSGTPSGTTTKTYSNVPIGTAAADRQVIIAISGTTRATAATVAGQACTLLYATGTGTFQWAFFLSPAISSGTTATITATFPSNPGNAGLFSYSVTGLISQVVDGSGTVTTSGATNNISTIAGGFVIGAFVGTGSPATSWTGATLDDSQSPSNSFSVASASNVAGGTRNVTATSGNFSRVAAIAMH